MLKVKNHNTLPARATVCMVVEVCIVVEVTSCNREIAGGPRIPIMTPSCIPTTAIQMAMMCSLEPEKCKCTQQ